MPTKSAGGAVLALQPFAIKRQLAKPYLHAADRAHFEADGEVTAAYICHFDVGADGPRRLLGVHCPSAFISR